MSFATLLLDWFHAHKRQLPWRTASILGGDAVRDPYAVWVSEVMLQQTTVSAATGFFTRWMNALPTVQSLAEADLDTVLGLWAGLGYYARARNLHRGAQFLVDNFAGKLPRTVPELLTVPGVGRYTAGAISSLAFNENAPLVDANVARVLCRTFQIPGDPKTDTKTQARLWQLATDLLPDGNAGAFNEAMMELGALVCVPKVPKCERCPLASLCGAFQSGQTEMFPQFAEKKMGKSETHISVAIFDESGLVLLAQRPPALLLWGGLWELPRARMLPTDTFGTCAARALFDASGLMLEAATPFGLVKHIVANRHISLLGYVGTVTYPHSAFVTENSAALAWGSPAALENYALATPQKKLLKLLETHINQTQLELTY